MGSFFICLERVRLMATIKTAIQMYNGMTPALRSMTGALNIAISSFETMQNVSSRAVDTRSLQAARMELNRAETVFNQIEQEIREADQAQQRFNNDIRNGQGAAAGLLTGFKNLAATMGATFGVKGIIETSDNIALATSRLDLMNDTLQTTAELQDIIFRSAQRARSPYLDTLKTVSKLGILAGDAFSSSKEIVAFAEQMNKQFKIGGASLIEQTAAMYQLTQAMASGRLQGDEFRSIRENAPLLAASIEDYMINAGVEGTMKEWSAEGLITADVIKNAMFAVADETEERFRRLPMTWGQVWTTTVNNIIRYSQPLLDFINLLANNWSSLAPVFWGLAAAVGAYVVATQLAALWTAINTTGTIAHTVALLAQSVGYGILALATGNAAMAQYAWNAAIAASGIGAIAIIIGVVIAAIYRWVQAVGGIKVAWLIATNVILSAWDSIRIGFMKGVYAVMTYVGNLKVDVLTDLQDMVNGAIDIINAFIRNVNSLPGVAFDTISNVTFATEARIKNNAAIAARDEKISQIEGIARLNALQRRYNIRREQTNANDGLWDSINNGVGDIAANTGKAADALEISEEDLKYLRDVAEREVIDRTVLRDVKVTLTNSFGDIRETADIDGIINKLETRLAEAIVNEAEGSYDSV